MKDRKGIAWTHRMFEVALNPSDSPPSTRVQKNRVTLSPCKARGLRRPYISWIT